MKISGIIITYNEEKNIEKALSSLDFCDEIIILDSYSTDETLNLARKNEKTKVYQRKIENDYSSQRNFALTKAAGEWVFFLDADEIIDPVLKEEIRDFIAYRGENYNGAYFKRLDYLWSKPLRFGETGKIKLIRLGRKDKGEWIGKVHERWDIKEKVYEFSNPIKHFPHKNINDFLGKIDYYSDLRSQELFEGKHKAGFISVLFYPKAKFVVNYIIKQGFRDGTPGFIHAILMSFHSFMVRGKLWQLWKEEK